MIRISRASAPVQIFPDGTTLNPSTAIDPVGPVVVMYDIGSREERYPVAVTFTPVVPAALVAPSVAAPTAASSVTPPPTATDDTRGGNGRVVVPVTTTGALENVPGTRKEESHGKIIAVLVALFLATLVGIGVYFLARGSNTPPPVVTTVVTPPPPAPVVTLPKCSDEIARCTTITSGIDAANAAALCATHVVPGRDCQ